MRVVTPRGFKGSASFRDWICAVAVAEGVDEELRATVLDAIHDDGWTGDTLTSYSEHLHQKIVRRLRVINRGHSVTTTEGTL